LQQDNTLCAKINMFCMEVLTVRGMSSTSWLPATK